MAIPDCTKHLNPFGFRFQLFGKWLQTMGISIMSFAITRNYGREGKNGLAVWERQGCRARNNGRCYNLQVRRFSTKETWGEMGQEQGKGPNISSGLSFLERTFKFGLTKLLEAFISFVLENNFFLRRESDDNLIKVILDVNE